MAAAYRLRVTLNGSDLILEYRDQREEEWALAGLYSHESDPKARSAFRWLQRYTALPNIIRDKFKEQGSDLPAELEAAGVVLVMREDDFRVF